MNKINAKFGSSNATDNRITQRYMQKMLVMAELQSPMIYLFPWRHWTNSWEFVCQNMLKMQSQALWKECESFGEICGTTEQPTKVNIWFILRKAESIYPSKISTLFDILDVQMQARNQLGHQRWRIIFCGAKIFNLCPIDFNYIQRIFLCGGNIFSVGSSPHLRPPDYGPVQIST